MIVMKFGGTSVNSAEKIKMLAEIVKENKIKHPVVVVSALRGVTDMLLETACTGRVSALSEILRMHQVIAGDIWGEEHTTKIDRYINSCITDIRNILKKTKHSASRTDAIIAYGEIMSSFLISSAFEYFGILSKPIIATRLIVTNDHFGSAEFLPNQTVRQAKKILPTMLKNKIVPVVTGFIGATEKGKITTLGRGGSDYSASILGFVLEVKEIQIWTDVDGIYSADPRRIIDATRLQKVSYQEASELAAFGAKVLHPSTIRPAVAKRIPVRVLSTLQPKNPGTVIVDEVKQGVVAGVASKSNVTLVNIASSDMLFQYGFLEKIFAVFAKHKISIDLVSVSEISVSVTLDSIAYIGKALLELSEFTNITVTKNVGIVSLIGEGIIEIPHIVKNIFGSLDNQGITPRMISFGATDINISLVVESLQVDRAVETLHKNFLPLIKRRREEIL